MNNGKLELNFAPSCEKAELVIREVSSVNELQVKPPVKTAISGSICAPYEFLLRRVDQPDQINQKRCHLLVNREAITIELIMNEDDEYKKGSVKGKLEIHPKFKEFGINQGEVWTPSELGMFFKMNRTFFTDKGENMRLVSELMNFTATVNNSIQKSVKETGSQTDNFESVVNSNLPKSFTLKIPIFKGMPAETLEVETFAKVSGREVNFILISPDASATEEDIRDKVIDEQLELIRELCPDIAQIEQ